MNVSNQVIATKTFNEFQYFYFQQGELKIAQSCSEVPLDVEDFCKVSEAINYVQGLGCQGRNQHKIQNNFHQLCLATLRWAVDNVGEVFPEVLRGVRSDRPDHEHKILFGTRDRQVAEFYGSEVKVYRNVRGLHVKCSTAKSVKTDDWDEIDDEIIFFPN